MRQILKNITDKIYFTIKYRQLSVTEKKIDKKRCKQVSRKRGKKGQLEKGRSNRS